MSGSSGFPPETLNKDKSHTLRSVLALFKILILKSHNLTMDSSKLKVEQVQNNCTNKLSMSHNVFQYFPVYFPDPIFLIVSTYFYFKMMHTVVITANRTDRDEVLTLILCH
jgi:hypothetical protein